MAKVRFVKGHTRYAYFAGDVVDVKDLGTETAKALMDGGFVVAETGNDTETPEGKLKAEAIEVRTGGEASTTLGAKVAPGEPAPIANVPDAERLGIHDKPAVSPEVDRNPSEGKPAKK